MVWQEPAKLSTLGSCAFDSRSLRQFVGARQIRIAAPVCKTGPSFDRSEFKSRGTHQIGRCSRMANAGRLNRPSLGGSTPPTGTITLG